jgi:hypothetical protein
MFLNPRYEKIAVAMIISIGKIPTGICFRVYNKMIAFKNKY